MIKPYIYKSPPFVLEKLLHLHDVLSKEKDNFESIATLIPNKQFCRTIGLLAQESNQYAREISSQIGTISGGTVYTSSHESHSRESCPQNIQSEDEILSYCVACEKVLIKAYREILNEPFLMEGLRSIMRYQLNGIMYAFLQLKLLGTTFRSNEV